MQLAQTKVTNQTVIEEEGLMTSEEAAAYLGISPGTFRVHVSKNIAPVKTRSAKRKFYRKQDLKNYFLGHTGNQEAKIEPQTVNV